MIFGRSQEAWATEAFNCTQAYNLGHGLQHDHDVADDDGEIFEESTSQASDGSRLFFASDDEARLEDLEGENIFYASDAEEEQHEPKKKRPRKTDQASFLGKPVCRRALASLVGLGGSTLEKLRHGEPAFTNNRRKPLAKHPTFGFALRGETNQVWEQIVMFFFHLYHTAAEVMPTNWHTIQEAGRQAFFETPFPEDDAQSVDKSEEMQRLVNAIGRTLNTSMTDVECQMIGPGTFAGPRRCLQHACRTDLYWEYLAYAEARGAHQASYGTFMKVANTIIKPGLRDGHLKFRKPGEHAQCDFCFQARERIRAARSTDAKLAEERELVRHRLSQWQDRQCYWALRSMSQTYFSQLLAADAR